MAKIPRLQPSVAPGGTAPNITQTERIPIQQKYDPNLAKPDLTVNQGIQDVSRSMARFGQVVSNIGMQKLEQLNAQRAATELSTAMQELQQSYNDFELQRIDNPDHTTWAPMFTEYSRKQIESISKNFTTPEAQARFLERANIETEQRLYGLESAALKRERQVNIDRYLDNLDSAIGNGRIDEAEEVILNARLSGIITDDIAEDHREKATREIAKGNAYQEALEMGFDQGMNWLMNNDIEHLTEEDRLDLVKQVSMRKSFAENQKQQAYDSNANELWKKHFNYQLTYGEIETAVNTDSITVDQGFRLRNALDAFVEGQQAQDNLSNTGTDVDPSQYIADLHQMIHDGTHPDVVENQIYFLEKNGLIKNAEARTLYNKNRNRDENPIIDQALKGFDGLAKQGISRGEIGRRKNIFLQQAERIMYDEKGNLRKGIDQELQDAYESSILPWQREAWADLLTEKPRNLMDDPKEDANNFTTLESVVKTISTGNYIFWDEQQRNAAQGLMKSVTGALEYDYDKTRRDDNRPKLRRQEPVRYHDGIRPVFIDENNNEWTATVLNNQITWTPYEPERLNQTGRVYQDPSVGAIYYVDNRWWTEEELAAEGRIGTKQNTTITGTTARISETLMVQDESGDWRIVY